MKRLALLTLLLLSLSYVCFAATVGTQTWTIQTRRDTGANWQKYNPVLAQGEDAYKLAGNPLRAVGKKVGDGVTPWLALPWFQNMSSATPVQAAALFTNYTSIGVFTKQQTFNGGIKFPDGTTQTTAGGAGVVPALGIPLSFGPTTGWSSSSFTPSNKIPLSYIGVSYSTPEMFGAHGDWNGTTGSDDSAALQTCADTGYCIADGKYKSTASIGLSSNSVFGGKGLIHFVGVAGLVKKTSGYLWRVRVQDLTIEGDNGGTFGAPTSNHGIYFAGSSGTDEFYESTIRNLRITNFSGKGIYLPKEFSNEISDNSVDRCNDNGIEWAGENTTVLARNYVHNVAPGYAAYRGYGKSILYSCNGIDSGDYWGFFGKSTADGDDTNNNFSVSIYDSNLEDWAKSGIKTHGIGSMNIVRSTFEPKRSNVYDYYIESSYNQYEVSTMIGCLLPDMSGAGATTTNLAMFKNFHPIVTKLYDSDREWTSTDGTTIFHSGTISQQFNSPNYQIVIGNQYQAPLGAVTATSLHLTNGSLQADDGSGNTAYYQATGLNYYPSGADVIFNVNGTGKTITFTGAASYNFKGGYAYLYSSAGATKGTFNNETGDATFAGTVTANRLVGDGSGIYNLSGSIATSIDGGTW